MLVAPGIYHFNTYPFNWYVIEEDSRLTLIDAGFPGHFEVFLEGIRSIGRTIDDIEAVILTHAHADHMGFADRVATAAKAPVFIHQDDRARAQRVLQLPWFALLSNAWRPYMAGMLSRAIVNGVITTACVKNPMTFNDGDVLDLPGRPQVIHVPGHTPGEVAFYFSEKQALISGDCIVTQDLYTGKLGGPQLTRPLLNSDYRTALGSLDRLSGLGPITIFPGHGQSWQGEAKEAIHLARSLIRN